MTFDIIILAYSKTAGHKKITSDCIKSIVAAENKIKANIIVLESFDEKVKFENAKTIFFKEKEFNYNRSMNEGFKHTTSDYVFFCNNDLVFHDYWADHCYSAFKMGYESISPYCPVTTPRYMKAGEYLAVGYQVGVNIPGWCIGVQREMFKRIGGFNEAVSFWYSDNIYGEQLKIAKIKHALVCNAFVTHLDYGSKTLSTLSGQERLRLTRDQQTKYKKELKKLYAKN